MNQALGSASSLDHYWRELSFNQINLTGSEVHGWYDLPNDRSYYVYDIDPNDAGDEVDFERLLDDAVSISDDDIYFPDFSGINLILNGNLDGGSWGGERFLFAETVQKWRPGPGAARDNVALGQLKRYVLHQCPLYSLTASSACVLSNSSWGRSCTISSGVVP